MGLIKAMMGAAFSTVADTWKDYIYCDSLNSNMLVCKGQRRAEPGSVKYGSENVITDGSCIAVNEGQFLILVENGKIIDFTAEPGGYTWDSKASPGFFEGSPENGLRNTLRTMADRFAHGGIASEDQRAYFVNTKEILNNKCGFGKVPFRDKEFNITILLQGFGVFSFLIQDPIKFFVNVSGNTAGSYMLTDLAAQLRAELQHAMIPALAHLSDDVSCYDQIPLHVAELSSYLNEELSALWLNTRGIILLNLSFQSILPDDESIDQIRQLQETRVYSEDHSMLGARVGAASAHAMESAAQNPSGAMNGFMGVNMAAKGGNVDVNALLNEEKKFPASPTGETWTCKCGSVNVRNFCPECGATRPIKQGYTCAKCGYVEKDMTHPPKFCPECGSTEIS